MTATWETWWALPSAPHPHLRSGRAQSSPVLCAHCPSPSLPREWGAEKAAPTFRHGLGEVCKQGRMGAASQTPTLLLRVGVPRKLSTWGCPSLHPFALPHAPQWGCAQPEGNTRGALLPFGAPPPLCMSTTLRGVPHAQPLCAPPFGCHTCAVPHVGWCVQGGIRKVGRAGVVHVG